MGSATHHGGTHTWRGIQTGDMPLAQGRASGGSEGMVVLMCSSRSVCVCVCALVSSWRMRGLSPALDLLQSVRVVWV
jgi:hypothetical protein